MTTDGTSTINQLMELFHASRKRQECVSLSLESKDGKDHVTFCLGNPTGNTEGKPKTWTPGSSATWPHPPWTWLPPSWTQPKRRKSPSQWRRDQQRREEFIAKKVKTEKDENCDKVVKATLAEPIDEIELDVIQQEAEKEVQVNDLFKIEGEYKNPNTKPWSVVDPEKEFKILWDMIKSDNKIKGIEEIGEGSMCFEHCFEFWGTWKMKKPGISMSYLKDSDNWPKGIKITEVKPG